MLPATLILSSYVLALLPRTLSQPLSPRSCPAPVQACKTPPGPLISSWLSAWHSSNGTSLASLFSATSSSSYTDHAFGASFDGTAGVEQWVTITTTAMSNVSGTLISSDISPSCMSLGTRQGQGRGEEEEEMMTIILFDWYFSAHIKGAPNGFNVSATTTLVVDREGKIVRDDDVYSHREVLEQSGLPADWVPGAGSGAGASA
ncbi:hypothetical protein T439DRAFT_330182 [Meredithblackwellia eburnea MCA 4105]